MTSVLVCVDVQNGFTPSNVRRTVVPRLEAAAQRFPVVAATLFRNEDGSLYMRSLDWRGMMGGTALDPAARLPARTKWFSKHGYSCWTPDFARWFDLIRPDEVCFAGADLDGCVMASVFACFDHGVQPVVLSDLCWTNGGVDVHLGALLCLEQAIGAGNVLPAREWLKTHGQRDTRLKAEP